MFMTAGFRDRAEVLFPESIPTGSRPWHLLRKFALILRAACPQTPCKDGIHPHLYRCGPLPYFDRYLEIERHNFVVPHGSLRQRLLVPEPTHGRSAAKVWRPCIPALAAGLTDHVWSLKEVLCYRVPPWPQPQIV